MAHAPAGLGADAGADHVVVLQHRAVEQERVRTRHTGLQLLGHPGAAGDVGEALATGLDHRADGGLGLGPDLHRGVLEPERHLAGHGEQRHREAGHRLEGLVESDRPALHDVCGHHVEDAIVGDGGQDAGRGVEREGLALAQGQQARDVIDVAVGQQHRVDRRVAQTLPRMHLRIGLDLLADVGGGVEQEPAFPVRGDRDARLRAWFDPGITGPGQGTDGAAAVPLGNAAARRRAQDHDMHGENPLMPATPTRLRSP